MRRKLTAWFPSGVTPKRRGVYQRHLGSIGIRFAYWNGRFWGGFATIWRHAYLNQESPTAHEDAPWRGLASPPHRRSSTTAKG